MATDYFGRTVNPGDDIWVKAHVTAINAGVFTLNYTNADNSTATLTATGGTSGSTTNPAEGDRPPR